MYISGPKHFSGKDIRNIRNNAHLSQSAFAAAMGVSKKTVEAWEAGTSNPTGPARRLLSLIEENPLYFDKTGIIAYKEPHAGFVDDETAHTPGSN